MNQDNPKETNPLVLGEKDQPPAATSVPLVPRPDVMTELWKGPGTYVPPPEGSVFGGKPTVPAVCRHRPTIVLSGIHGGKKWEIYAGSESRVAPHLWEYDLILNCSGQPIRHRKHIIPTGLGINTRLYAEPMKRRELCLDWPDFSHPSMPARFWTLLYQAIRKKGRTLVYCLGGHGRTGTALSILAAVHYKLDGTHAVKVVRKSYCYLAVESASQMEYVRRVTKLLGLKGKGCPGYHTGKCATKK